MAAALGRKVSGLLRPLLLFTRAPKVCQFSTIGQPQMIRKIASAPVWSTKLCQPPQQSILQRVLPYLPSLVHQPCRNLTYFSVKKGKRKSVKSVTERFLRLHCGLWVRRQAGYKKKLWKKLPARKKRLREFIFCNKTQCKLLDKMTTSFWKRRNWYLNDPYFKYHDRVNLKV
ncbi:39S ribosomal protein L35, mitochondrial isoform X2 [Lampris incognitus]|uniref:39S ribosomal protein L35, mitochondrial isoform X2 n=1 Tax=Lampris incognitus TaxID=2546036 RepID=UPI0024B5A87F|nr:39S ribosomal protein L35, mitochondrial isoform X2 [Lampris incognitus]